jgi:hypothetical protein
MMVIHKYGNTAGHDPALPVDYEAKLKTATD